MSVVAVAVGVVACRPRPSPVVPVGGAGCPRGGFRASRPSVGRPSVVGFASVPVRRVKRAGGRRPVVLLSRRPCRPPCRGGRPSRQAERGAGACKGAFVVGVVRRVGRGRSSLSRSRVAVVPVPPFGGGRVASVLSPCPSCPSVSPRRRGRLSAGAVRPCPVVRGRGRAGCRSVSVVRGCRLFAVAGRRGRSPVRPSGSRAGVAPVAFRRGSRSPICPRPPLRGVVVGCRSPCPPCGGRSPVSPYTRSIRLSTQQITPVYRQLYIDIHPKSSQKLPKAPKISLLYEYSQTNCIIHGKPIHPPNSPPAPPVVGRFGRVVPLSGCPCPPVAGRPVSCPRPCPCRSVSVGVSGSVGGNAPARPTIGKNPVAVAPFRVGFLSIKTDSSATAVRNNGQLDCTNCTETLYK